MSKISVTAAVLAVAFAAASVVAPAVSAENQNTRTVLLNEPTHLPNNRLMLVAVEIPVDGREGRHTHPGSLVVYVQEGVVSLYYEGRPETTYRVGESFFVEAGAIHEGINLGNVPAKVLATFLVEEGVPLVTQVE